MRLHDDQPSGTVARARQLRRDASTPERRLLRSRREAFPDLKWRHREPIGPCRADIPCFGERLMIEVDGDTHATMTAHDAARTAPIKDQGFTVTRFAHPDMMQFEGVPTPISFSLRAKEGAHAQHGKGEGGRTCEKGAPA